MRATLPLVIFSLLCMGCLLLGSSPCRAQQAANAALPSPDSLTPNTPGNYLATLAALRPQRERYAASPQWRDLYFQELATCDSFIGNDAEAIADLDASRAASTPTGLPSDWERNPSVAALRGYRPVDAKQAVLTLAETHRVLFINEAHHVPQGRAFILSLLTGLYQRGYRYYAAETFGKDGDLQKRGYPAQKTGYYTKEPVFGAVVRTALKLGFRLVPYEYVETAKPSASDSDPFAGEDQRERGEAQNLYDRILKHDPEARILVHAGYGHIGKQITTMSWSAGDLGAKKGGSATLIPMAIYLQRISGIVPFSIDNSDLYAHGVPDHESLLYRYMTSRGLVKGAPTVFRNARGQYYVSPSVRGVYDVMISHPRPRYENGRPTWLRMGGLRRPVALPPAFAAPRTVPVLVQAFCRNEDPNQAVPVDQVEILPGADPPALMLPTGRFLLRLMDASGKALNQQPVTVKETS